MCHCISLDTIKTYTERIFRYILPQNSLQILLCLVIRLEHLAICQILLVTKGISEIWKKTFYKQHNKNYQADCNIRHEKNRESSDLANKLPCCMVKLS